MHITMAPDEWTTFAGFVRCAGRYVEFGAGASTVLAAASVRDWAAAFDSSQGWLDRVAEACRARQTRLTPTLSHVDIGETGEWGFPKDATSRDRWPLYHSSMWDDGRLAEADLYLVDGRFRLACFAQALLHCGDHAFVAFHDYASRPYYHAAAVIAREVARVDDLSIFMRPPGFDSELARRLVADHAHDPR
ncbi:MAG: hypothetical protein AB7F09_01925 [Parvibaculaceae bacterium]